MNTVMIFSKKGERLNLVVPEELAKLAKEWADELEISLSELSRQALITFVNDLERKKREQALAEACENYRKFNKKFSSEWAKFETRIP